MSSNIFDIDFSNFAHDYYNNIKNLKIDFCGTEIFNQNVYTKSNKVLIVVSNYYLIKRLSNNVKYNNIIYDPSSYQNVEDIFKNEKFIIAKFNKLGDVPKVKLLTMCDLIIVIKKHPDKTIDYIVDIQKNRFGTLYKLDIIDLKNKIESLGILE